jgi:[ribosomal protein S5]-alanine N-acetyltransferase
LGNNKVVYFKEFNNQYWKERKLMRFIGILEDGSTEESVVLNETARQVCSDTAALYKRAGYDPPWIGYLALIRENVLGTCCFKSAPVNGRVEIAYFTFPGHEGRGVATSMAAGLIKIARDTEQSVTVFAHTLAEESPSTSILKKLGFQYTGKIIHPEDGEIWEWELPNNK